MRAQHWSTAGDPFSYITQDLKVDHFNVLEAT